MFERNTIQGFLEHEQRLRQMIIEFIKKNIRPIEDKNFLLICGEMKQCYITFDFDKNEEVYLSIVDKNKTYDVGFLVETLLRELIRLWKLERKC